MDISSFDSPDSSSVTHASYDHAARRLVVEFKSGKKYQGDNVPEDVWEAFDAAASKGWFFNTHIRPMYSMVQV